MNKYLLLGICLSMLSYEPAQKLFLFLRKNKNSLLARAAERRPDPL